MSRLSFVLYRMTFHNENRTTCLVVSCPLFEWDLAALRASLALNNLTEVSEEKNTKVKS